MNIFNQYNNLHFSLFEIRHENITCFRAVKLLLIQPDLRKLYGNISFENN